MDLGNMMFGNNSDASGNDMNKLPDYESEIDKLFERLEDDKSFTDLQNKIVVYVNNKVPKKKEETTGTTEEATGGKKKRKSKKKTKKMKKSKKSKTAKKKKH